MAISSFSSFSVLPPPPPPPPLPQAKIEPPPPPQPVATIEKVEALPVPPVEKAEPAPVVTATPPEPRRNVPLLPPPEPRFVPQSRRSLVAGVFARWPLLFLFTAAGVGVGYWWFLQQPVETEPVTAAVPTTPPITANPTTPPITANRTPPVGTPGQTQNLNTLRLERDQLQSDLELSRAALRNAEPSDARTARLDSNRSKSNELERRLASVKTDREAIEKLKTAKRPAPPAIDNRATEDKIAALEADKARLGTRLGPDHPEMVGLQTRINALKAEIKKAVPPANDLSDFTPFLAALDREEKNAAAQREQLKQAIDRDEAEAAKLRLLTAGIEGNAIRLAALEELIVQRERVQVPAAVAAVPEPQPAPPTTTAAETNPATTTEKTNSPLLTRFLVMGGLGGLLVGCFAAAGLELMTRPAAVRVVARSQSGVPVLGQMPRIRTDLPATRPSAGGLDPILVAFHRPTAPDAVAIREIRTQMNLALGVRDHQMVQVTSPTRGDGKSTLAANLAVGLAQSGKKVILVDCDFRSPRIHALFAVANPDTGLASVLASEAKLSEAIDECEVPNLTLLLSGTRPVDPVEIFSSAKFTDLMAELRQEYEFVIVDSPPVLAQRDAQFIAARADGVTLVTRGSREGQASSERAQQQLASSEARLLGTVVNAAPQRGTSPESASFAVPKKG